VTKAIGDGVIASQLCYQRGIGHKTVGLGEILSYQREPPWHQKLLPTTFMGPKTRVIGAPTSR